MTQRTKTAIAAGVSTAAVLTVATLVLLFGIVRTPSFESLQDKPDSAITGTIAFVKDSSQQNASQQESCVLTVAAAGGHTPEQIHCAAEPMQVRWIDDGRLAVVETRNTLIFDVQTKQKVETIPTGGDPWSSYAPPPLETPAEVNVGDDYDEGRTNLRDSKSGDKLVSLRAPDDYSFRDAGYSPDRKWLWALDSKARILLANADGSNMRELLQFDDSDHWYPNSYRNSLAWFQSEDKRNTITVQQLRDRSAAPTRP